MNPESFSKHEQKSEKIEEPYLDPEKIEVEKLESLLVEGEIINIRPIENHHQVVPPHADRVLLGDIDHADQLFEGEIQIPGEDKKILVVYKPESGINKGTDTGKPLPIPKESSPYMNKERAAWLVAKSLWLADIAEPVAIRSLNEGPGSVRPYIWGEPVELLPQEKQDEIFGNQETMEDFALYDFILLTVDRRPANMIWEETDGQEKIKAIDHSLTFFSEGEEFASRWERKGPRLATAYDISYDPERLKKTSLPDRHLLKLDQFMEKEQNIRQDLAELLTEKEINGIFSRAQKLLEQKIFL